MKPNSMDNKEKTTIQEPASRATTTEETTIWQKHRSRFIGVLVVGLLVVPAFFDFFRVDNTRHTAIASAPAINDVVEPPVEPPKKEDFFAGLNLEATAVYVWDISKQEPLFALNEEAQLPLASLTKIMTAVVAKNTLPAGETITIRAEDIMQEGDSGLYLYETWKVEDLIDYTLVTSSNDGASALAAASGAIMTKTDDHTLNKQTFIKRMNQKAKNLGLEQTYFLNEAGLDLSTTVSGSYGSAKDMTLLMEYVLKTDGNLLDSTVFDDISVTSESLFTHYSPNTNSRVESIPGILASKTGYTDLAGGNLVILLDIGIGHYVAISVLGSTYEGRFEDMEKLIWASIGYISAAASVPSDTTATNPNN